MDEMYLGQIMAIRLLLTQLYIEKCEEADDPVAMCESYARQYIEVLDESGDAVSQFALHDLEFFWKQVAGQIRGRA